MKKNMILIILLFISYFSINSVLAENNNSTVNLSNNDIVQSNENDKVDLLMKSLELRKESITKIISKDPLEKVIEDTKSKKQEINIQKDVYLEINSKIEKEIENINKVLKKNESLIEEYKKTNELSVKKKKELEKIEKENEELKQTIQDKEKKIIENKEKIKIYEDTKSKLQSIIEENNKLLAEQKEIKQKELNGKLYILYIGLAIYFIIILLVSVGRRKQIKPTKDSTRFYSNVEVNSTISIILFVFIFIFYVFPSLIGILVLGTVGLLMINSNIVSSFLWSKLVLSRLNIGDEITYKSGGEFINGKVKGVSVIGLFVKQIDEFGNDIGVEDFIMHRQALLDRIQKKSKRNKILFEPNIVINSSQNKEINNIISFIEKEIKKKIKDKGDIYLGTHFVFTDSSNVRVYFKFKIDENKKEFINQLILSNFSIYFNKLEKKEAEEEEE